MAPYMNMRRETGDPIPQPLPPQGGKGSQIMIVSKFPLSFKVQCAERLTGTAHYLIRGIPLPFPPCPFARPVRGSAP